MTYTGSKAIAGRGSILSVGATPTVVGEVKSSGFTGNKWDTVDVTNYQSGPDREFIVTVRDNGTLKVAGNRVSTDAGQLLVEAAYGTGAITAFILTLPKSAAQTTTGDTYGFNALVESRSFDDDVTKEISWDVSLKISGAVTFTAGT
jgi:hypothetical protein